ncbi:hypothetical protein D3C80_760850 [compost metagenome]
MATRDTVQDVRFQHSVIGNTAQFNAVILQNAAIKFEVLPNFFRFLIFEERFQQFQHAVAGDLIRGIKIVMRDGNIGRHAWLRCK